MEDSIFCLDKEETKIFVGYIKSHYPEYSSSEIRRLMKQNAIRLLSYDDPDSTIKEGTHEESILHDWIDEWEYEKFLEMVEENNFKRHSIMKVGKLKRIYMWK